MIRATMNGQTHEFEEHTRIREAARIARLQSAGVCRLGVVSTKGHPSLATACHTPLVDGVKIATEGQAARIARL
jgi:NADH dehydrogenase/NADH:ubiquinone oxidoreductase subunit G